MYRFYLLLFMLLVLGKAFSERSAELEFLNVLNETLFERIDKKYGSDAVTRIKEWKELIVTHHTKSHWEKLHLVNDFFNKKIKFVNDSEHWGKSDYWATPIQFIASNGGDCEDFSIAKYFTLKVMGVDSSLLRLMYVRALDYDQAHMVLIYSEKPTDVPLVLDNLNKKIRPATKRKDLKPIYSFNGDGLWLAKARSLGKKVKSRGGIVLWDDVLTRIENGDI